MNWRQERLAFHDPARNLVVSDPQRLPKSVPSDVLAGLLRQAATESARLVIALAAVHALPGQEIRALLDADLDLSAGRLIVRRRSGEHIVFLEELTHTLASQWITYRHRRWPMSSNPYLLVTQRTALDPDRARVSAGSLRYILPAGVTIQQLRQDRILHEAAVTADPLRLIRLFGISAHTAMRYTAAAHPQRVVELPGRSNGPRRRRRN
jgi:integrase